MSYDPSKGAIHTVKVVAILAVIAMIALAIVLVSLYVQHRRNDPYQGLSRKDRRQLKAEQKRQELAQRQLELDERQLLQMQRLEQYVQDPRTRIMDTDNNGNINRKDIP
ncbi:MAG TPA: hypothetical protein VK978_00170 [Candidatus Saccharimonadales bacterium]|nr:hypothetical protein [Candidatus Saccharimonadales bacterium]